MNSEPPLATEDEMKERIALAWRDGKERGSLSYSCLCDVTFACIRLILSEPTLLRIVAKRSYIHPNGFLKFVLCPSAGKTPELRIHAWRASTFSECQIHNHAWDFFSAAVEGVLRKTIYRLENGDDLMLFSVFPLCFRGQGDEKHYETSYLGRRSVCAEAAFDLPKGTCYYFNRDVLHAVESVETPATTFVLQGPIEKQSAFVLSEDELEGTTDHVEGLAVGDLEFYLQEILRLDGK